MAKRKTARPASRSSGRRTSPEAGRTRVAGSGRGEKATGSVTIRPNAPDRPRSGGQLPDAGPARDNTPPRSPGTRPPAASGTAGPRRERLDDQFEDVTAEIQRRWDLEEEDVPTPPSTLDLDRRASAARSGHDEMVQRRKKHTAASPALTGGDVDADWEGAYTVGEEAATGDNPTPDQDRVDDIGRAVGVDYEDNEELKSAEKIERRDKKRWELDPASSEDYKERNRKAK